MTNTLGAYNPIFYANETLIHLRKVLGLAGRVHRGYELERNSFRRGDTITIRKPATFAAQDAPSSSQDLNTSSLDIKLDQWKEVKFELSDKERAYTNDIIIEEHIGPAAYALADTLDQSLAAQYKNVPWVLDYGTATDTTIITAARKQLFDNQAPMNDNRIHFMVESGVEAYFLNSSVFHSAQVTGGTANQEALMRGGLGTRFGVEVFANQNAPTHTPGTLSKAAGDKALAVTGAHAKGVSSIVMGSGTGTETVVPGDTFVIAGHTQRYSVTNSTAVSSGAITVNIFPTLAVALAGSEVVTFGTAPNDSAHSVNLMFHRNWLGLAVAPLPDDLPGIEAFTATDPVQGLSVRARRWADGDNSKIIMALDVLYGHKVLDANLAVRTST